MTTTQCDTHSEPGLPMVVRQFSKIAIVKKKFYVGFPDNFKAKNNKIVFVNTAKASFEVFFVLIGRADS